jgi:hypothetical protein
MGRGDFMLKKIIFSLILICTIVSISESQMDRQRRDGLWWNSLDEMHRTNYMIGYAKGIQIGSQAVLDSYIKESKCYINGKVDVDTLLYNMYFVSPDYMIYKVDSIYSSDSTNLGLMLFHTYYLAIIEVFGASEEELRQMYYMFRREDCDKFQTFEELNNYQLSY